MRVLVAGLLCVVGWGGADAGLLAAQGGTPPRPAAQARVRACGLLSREEVRALVPWSAMLDQIAEEEEAIGTSGSSCNYPSVHVQVLPFSPQTMDVVRQKPGAEAVGGLGQSAYLVNNSGEYAEVYVQAGPRLLTVQANVEGSFEATKPRAIALARALVARLP